MTTEASTLVAAIPLIGASCVKSQAGFVRPFERESFGIIVAGR